MITSLFTLLDDVAAILDDVSVMTKVAAKQAAGVAGDDLALGANQVSGVNADRELPVIYAVAKGALLNKAFLVPAALLISVVAPWLIVYLLIAGGLYLCLEGFEKVSHYLRGVSEHDDHINLSEAEKIRGAIRTDMVLSGEIITIALGVVAASPFITKLSVLVIVAVVMTVGIYGLVALIIKLDDFGLYLVNKPKTKLVAMQNHLGNILIEAAPKLMRVISVAGTAAMFLVGGGILVHNTGLHHVVHDHLGSISHLNAAFLTVFPYIIEVVVGLIAGAISLVIYNKLEKYHVFNRLAWMKRRMNIVSIFMKSLTFKNMIVGAGSISLATRSNFDYDYAILDFKASCMHRARVDNISELDASTLIMKERMLGQFSMFLFCMTSVALSTYLALNNHDEWSIAIIVATASVFVLCAILSEKLKKPSREL